MDVRPGVAVFICYRSSDSAEHADRLYELLVERLGSTRVWRVIDEQPHDQEAFEAVAEKIAELDVILVVVGPDWLAADADGRRLIDDPADPVRREIEEAAAHLGIIPVLVGGARQPELDEVPETLFRVAMVRPVELHENTFEADVEALVERLEIFEERVIDGAVPGPPLYQLEPPPGVLAKPVEPDRPIYVDENVQFTVYRPRTIQPGRWSSLLAFAHLSDRRPDEPDALDPLEEVRRQAEQVLGEDVDAYIDLRQDALAGVPREGEITFLPAAEDVEFNPPSRTFRWLESVHREEFRLRTIAAAGQTIRGGISVFLGVRLLAEVGLQFTVSDEAAPARSAPVFDDARPYRRIFASYSHKDVRIAEQFEQYAAVFGDRYLRDWIDLRAGENWSERLGDMIREADVFQLFWSRNSMGSANVRQEWEYALSLNRPNFVRPTYWEFPMPRDSANGLPPPALSALHFQRLAVEPIAATPPAPSVTDKRLDASPSPLPPAPPAAVSVIVCGNCGFKNDATNAFCGSCGQFLEWAGQEVGEPAAEREPSPAPPDEAATMVPPPAALPPAPPRAQPATSKPNSPPASPRRRPAEDTPGRAAKPGDIICAACQGPNDPTRKFCRRCGSSLATAAPAKPWVGDAALNHKTTGPPPGRRSRSRPATAISLVALVVVVALTLLVFVSALSFGAPPRP